MFKRVGLFLITNILILVAVTIITSLFGLDHYYTEAGIDYKSLMGYCLIWGMVGSFISLALSRVMAKWMMKIKVIDLESAGNQRALVEMVHRISRKANLPKMPEVGIYDSPEVNAFATGPTKSRALVAVSTGLLQQMNSDEIEGVIAHEIAHIENGDMITMTLVQGVINAFVLFFAKIVAHLASSQVKESMQFIVYIGVQIAMQILFGFLGMIVVGWFSRRREFAADAGSARLVGREKMIAALEALKNLMPLGHSQGEEVKAEPAIASLKISSGHTTPSWKMLFSTHPPLDERIAALRK